MLPPAVDQHSGTTCTGQMSVTGRSCSRVVFTTTLCFCFPAQPNELRLSCGAELEYSQTEFYNTVCTSVTGSVEHGRRQLQALVRQPAPAGLNPDQERCGRLRRQHQARSPALVKPGRSCVQKAVHRAGRPLV